MKTARLLTATVLACATVCGLPALAQDHGAGEEWETLYDEVLTLQNTGQYGRGVVVAQKALAVAEQNVGANHPDTATSLEYLALFYRAQAEYAKAEPLYKRALAIKEKAYGPDHPSVAKSLENLAALYRKSDRDSQAVELSERAAAILAK